MKKSNKQKFIWADLIRIIAVYFVIVVHTSMATRGNWGSIFLFAVSKTSVPLFIMLSGALLLGKKEHLSIFFIKRIKRLLIPWLLWTGIYMVWKIYYHNTILLSIHDFNYLLVVTFLSQFWFLPLIAGLYIITPALRKYIQSETEKDINYILYVWFFFVSIIPFLHPSITFPVGTSSSLMFQTIQYVGYYLAGYILIHKKYHLKHIIIFSFLFLISIIFGLIRVSFISLDNHNALLETFEYLSPNEIITSITLFLLLFMTGNAWAMKISPVTKNILTTLSKTGFSILLLHPLLLEIISPSLSFFFLTTLKIDAAFIGLLKGIVGFLVCFLIVYPLRKIPLVKYLVL